MIRALVARASRALPRTDSRKKARLTPKHSLQMNRHRKLRSQPCHRPDHREVLHGSNPILVRASEQQWRLLKAVSDENQQHKSRPINPSTSQVVKRVPDVIAENKDWVVNTWLQRVKTNPELMSLKVSDAERRDHVPDLLDDAIADACDLPTSVEQRQKAAERHGTLRYHQGYSIAMLILEAQILQRVLAECIRHNVHRIALETLTPDITKLWDTITSELRESANAYMNQREWRRP
jgi:hypothetical protein